MQEFLSPTESLMSTYIVCLWTVLAAVLPRASGSSETKTSSFPFSINGAQHPRTHLVCLDHSFFPFCFVFCCNHLKSNNYVHNNSLVTYSPLLVYVCICVCMCKHACDQINLLHNCRNAILFSVCWMTVMLGKPAYLTNFTQLVTGCLEANNNIVK